MIAQTTDHKSMMVQRRYIREGTCSVKRGWCGGVLEILGYRLMTQQRQKGCPAGSA